MKTPDERLREARAIIQELMQAIHDLGGVSPHHALTWLLDNADLKQPAKPAPPVPHLHLTTP